jgi:hypothetical protein
VSLSTQKNTLCEENIEDQDVFSDDSDADDDNDDDDHDHDDDVCFDEFGQGGTTTLATVSTTVNTSLPKMVRKKSKLIKPSSTNPNGNKNNIVMLKDQKIQNFDLMSSTKELSDEINHLKMNPSQTSKYIACWKIVNLVFEIFKHSWLRCRHLGVIMIHFFQGHIKRSKHFGSYRVELVVLLFHRLTDIQNFDVITKRLMPSEIACLYCRLGYLKVFNPMKPEGAHFLNISNREERIIIKLMGALSTLEPGETWIDETFQWELEMDPIPGWYVH